MKIHIIINIQNFFLYKLIIIIKYRILSENIRKFKLKKIRIRLFLKIMLKSIILFLFNYKLLCEDSISSR